MQAVELAYENDWYDTQEVVAHITRLLAPIATKAL